jgi:hypothetical protein
VSLEAAAVFEARADLVVAVGQALREGLAPFGLLAHLLLEPAQLSLECIELDEGRLRLLTDGVRRTGIDFLTEQAESHASGAVELSAVDGLLARQRVEKGRLARSVRADDPDPIPTAHHRGSLAKEHAIPDSFLEIFEA